MQKLIKEIRSKLLFTSPVIHCITNPISINQCANLLLAFGCRPIMAEHPREVEEITKTAKALLLNLGNITDARIESIPISARCASETNIPLVLDAVGVACSHFRKRFIFELLRRFTPTLIKGNYSEINAIYDSEYFSKGVDSETTHSVYEMCCIASRLSRKLNCYVLASGASDIISDGDKVFIVRNGVAQLGKTTGTGCMQGALAAAFLSVSRSLDSVAAACAVLGICGELAQTENRNGTFSTLLLDALSSFSDNEIAKLIKTEERRIEKV